MPYEIPGLAVHPQYLHLTDKIKRLEKEIGDTRQQLDMFKRLIVGIHPGDVIPDLGKVARLEYAGSKITAIVYYPLKTDGTYGKNWRYHWINKAEDMPK